MKSKELVGKWLKQLVEKTGRSENELKNEGLLYTDFTNYEVKINFEDRSQVLFKYAFTLQDPSYPGVIAVFTEHNGYHEFPFGEEDDLIIIK